MSRYRKPQNIANDMGGTGEALDERMSQIFDLLKFVPDTGRDILDLGFGKGQISYYFRSHGKNVTSIGLELESYGIDIKSVNRDGIRLIEADMEDMPFQDHMFDCVVASHIYEHTLNLGRALDETKRVLKKEGWLVLFIPRYTDVVCAGHVNTGWNLGQLIYVLGIKGFDVKNGHFIAYGYSGVFQIELTK